jgi:hypothetical protein
MRVGRVGFEPTRAFTQRILSPRRLPFRHRPWHVCVKYERAALWLPVTF